MKTNYLSFEVVEINNCKLLALSDTSSYVDSSSISEQILQIVLPDTNPSGNTIEMYYYPNGVTILNSNTVGLTNVDTESSLSDLPDGLWIGKISICPHDTYWFEKKWYRTCLLECKFNKAFLKLFINPCTSCTNKSSLQKLDYIERLIKGIKANVSDCNFEEADSRYNEASILVDEILDCTC